MKRNTLRLLNIILAIAMVFTTMFAGAHRVYAEGYGIFINGDEITDENPSTEKYEYDPQNSILTLKDDIKNTTTDYATIYSNPGITLRIKTEGSEPITITNSNDMPAILAGSADAEGFLIFESANLKINGDVFCYAGNITVKNNSTIDHNGSYFYADNRINIMDSFFVSKGNNGISTSDGEILIKDSYVEVSGTADGSYGIDAKTLDVVGDSYVKATGKTTGIRLSNAPILEDDACVVTPTKGKFEEVEGKWVVQGAETVELTPAYPLWVNGIQVTVRKEGDILGNNTASYDPTSKTLTFNNVAINYNGTADLPGAITIGPELSEFTIKGTGKIINNGSESDPANYGYGVYTEVNPEEGIRNNVTFFGGDMDLTISGTSSAVLVNGNLEIDDGTLTVNSTGNGIVAYGIIRDDSGTVNVLAGANGILSYKSLEIAAGKVNAVTTGEGIGAREYAAISGDGGVYIHDSTVTAKSEGEGNPADIYSRFGSIGLANSTVHADNKGIQARGEEGKIYINDIIEITAQGDVSAIQDGIVIEESESCLKHTSLDGSVSYKYDEDNKKITDADGNSVKAVRIVSEHDWDDPVYEWENDNSYVSATVVCKNNENHVRGEISYTTRKVVKEPTIEEEGEAEYTATFSVDLFKTQTKKVPIPRLEPEKYTITFNLDGGTLNGQSGTVTMSYNDGTTITLPSPVRSGYTFDFWEGSRYNAGDKYTITENHTFKAIWKKTPADDRSSRIPKTGVE